MAYPPVGQAPLAAGDPGVLSETSLLFAQRKGDGHLVGITEVPGGLDYRCRCPACGMDLVARKGGACRGWIHHPNRFACDQQARFELGRT